MAQAVNSSDYAVKYSLARQKAASAAERREEEALRAEAGLKNAGDNPRQQELNLRELAQREIGRARNISRVV